MHFLADLLHALRDPSVLISAVGMVGIPIIIFVETGLLFPMLPGDSLLVTAGVLGAQGGGAGQPHRWGVACGALGVGWWGAGRAGGPVQLNVWVLAVSCSIAAILGNSSGYFIGNRAGHALFTRDDARFVKPAQLLRAHGFYE